MPRVQYPLVVDFQSAVLYCMGRVSSQQAAVKLLYASLFTFPFYKMAATCSLIRNPGVILIFSLSIVAIHFRFLCGRFDPNVRG